MIARRFAISILLLLLAATLTPAQGLVETALRITTKDAGKKGLEAVMVRPNEPGPHPLALLAHGAPRDRG